MKKTIIYLIIILVGVTLTGCTGNDDTIQTIIVSNSSYTVQNELESVNQTEKLTADEPVYASIHFVESPKGMEYTVKWYLDGSEIKTETKATANDTHDVVVYELEVEKVSEGTLKLEVVYKNATLLTKELIIQ